MMLAWHWPWAALAGVLATLAIIVLIVVFARRNAADDTPVFSMDDDLNTEHASRLFRHGALWAVSPSACWCLRWRWPLCWWLAPAKWMPVTNALPAEISSCVWMCRGPRSPMIARSSTPIWNWSSISRGNVSV